LKQTVILFDLDGTLIDSTEAILRCFDDSFKHFGLPTPPSEEIKALIGHPLDYMYAHLGVPKERVWDFVDIYKAHYRTRSKPMTKLLPHAKEAIVEASAFARLGVVTTKTGLYSKILLEHMGIMDYFEVLIGREDVVEPKPHPEPILKALHKMDVAYRNDVWMVGDTCLDMVSAKDAQVRGVGVLCGYGKRNELARCSDYLQNNALQAVRLIEELKKKLKLSRNNLKL
jgi:phosphoglycolate phosphatase